MQTFLPYSSFIKTANCLDYRRLGKQRVEARQILTSLRNGGVWRNHPAVRMWAGYEFALTVYSNVMIEEWVRRGYNNTMPIILVLDYVLPSWFGDERLHASHRSNLLRKDPKYYGQFGWVENPDLPYHWPF
jgi:hypothetical protein